MIGATFQYFLIFKLTQFVFNYYCYNNLTLIFSYLIQTTARVYLLKISKTSSRGVTYMLIKDI